MKPLVSVILILLFLLVTTTAAEGKVLPQAKGGSGKRVTSSSGGSLSVSPKLRKDRKALIVNFSGLQSTKNVLYSLVYETNGQQEGAGGTISSSGNTASREVLFGTCSKNVCRYHQNITNMHLEVESTLKNGKKTVKRYRIKV